jgi:hypothetical protein
MMGNVLAHYGLDPEVKSLYQSYLKKVEDFIALAPSIENNDRLTLERILPLNALESSAITVFTSNAGCRAINTQLQLGVIPAESLSSFLWIASRLNNILPKISKDGVELTIAQAIDELQTLIKLSKDEFVASVLSLDSSHKISSDSVTMKDMLVLFNQGLSKISDGRDILFHGVPQSSILNKDHAVGEIIEIPSYLSTSYDPLVSAGFSKDSKKFFSIRTKRSKDITKFSVNYKHEEEHLLLPKTKIRILGSKKQKIVDYCLETDRCKEDEESELENIEHDIIDAEEI